MSRNTSKKSSSVILRLFKDSHITKRQVIWLCIIILSSRLCLTMAPHISGRITDLIVSDAKDGKMDMVVLIRNCVALALLYLAGRGGTALISTTLLGITQNSVRNLRNRALKKINVLPIQYLDSHPIGDLISRLTNDIQSISSVIDSTFRIFVGEGILLIGVLIMMARINIRLMLIYVVVLPIGLALSYFIVSKCMRFIRQQINLLGDLSAQTEDAYRNYQMIKVYNCENQIKKNFWKTNKELFTRYIRNNFLIGFIMPVSVLTNNICFILECVIGSVLLIKGQLTLGEFQAFLIYGNMILSPLSDLSSAINSVQTGKVSAERVYEFLNQEEEPDESEKQELSVNLVQGEITFKHVKFGYSPEKELMKDVNFHVPYGKTVAIVGPTGAGKTTLVNLLMRFYDIHSGEILLDGVDIKSIKKKNVRQAFGMVLQDSWIFDGTVAENIAYGKPEASIEEIKVAAEKSFCSSFIEQMQDQYQTHLYTNQMQLSAGEKQLISIARAMLIDPPILILDEATSQIDTRTEELITNAITELIKNRTCFIIAHRLVTIRNADMILYMENGDVVEMGNHNSLMQLNGKYAQLYRKNAEIEV